MKILQNDNERDAKRNLTVKERRLRSSVFYEFCTEVQASICNFILFVSRQTSHPIVWVTNHNFFLTVVRCVSIQLCWLTFGACLLGALIRSFSWQVKVNYCWQSFKYQCQIGMWVISSYCTAIPGR